MTHHFSRMTGKAQTVTDILVTTLNLATELLTEVDIYYVGEEDECRIAVTGDDRYIRHNGTKWEAKE